MSQSDEQVKAAEEFFAKNYGCSCAAVDNGVGVMHEPFCGQPTYEDLALLLSRREASVREECAKVARTTQTGWATESERRRCAEYGDKIAAAIRALRRSGEGGK